MNLIKPAITNLPAVHLSNIVVVGILWLDDYTDNSPGIKITELWNILWRLSCPGWLTSSDSVGGQVVVVVVVVVIVVRWKVAVGGERCIKNVGK